MSDKVTISMTFERPDDETFAAIVSKMTAALPKGNCRLRIEGATPNYAAAFDTSVAIQKARRKAKRK